MGHVTPGGGTPAREQPVNRDGGPTLGRGTPTSAGNSISGGTSTQKVFLKYDIWHSKRYVSCILDYQVFIYLFALLENHHGSEQQVHWARKFQTIKVKCCVPSMSTFQKYSTPFMFYANPYNHIQILLVDLWGSDEDNRKGAEKQS